MSVCSISDGEIITSTVTLSRCSSESHQHLYHCQSKNDEVDEVNSLLDELQSLSKDEHVKDLYEFDVDAEPLVERWAPLGATGSPQHEDEHIDVDEEEAEFIHIDTVRQLEAEQEQLNSSLMALTSHFAQVQFRLKQIVSAPSEEKDDMLKQLEEFAFRGIPDMRLMGGYATHMEDKSLSDADADGNTRNCEEEEQHLRFAIQREKQLELIEQLKHQLEDLESFAYETGDRSGPPTAQVMEKQRLVIDELRQRLDLNLEDMNLLSAEELRAAVDRAVGQIVNPAKVKEKLVDQLKTQIVDLERFIDFLQGEISDLPLSSLSPELMATLKERGFTSTNAASATTTTSLPQCPLHGTNRKKYPTKDTTGHAASLECLCKRPVTQKVSSKSATQDKNSTNSKDLRDATLTMMKRAITILQLYTVSHLGCGTGSDFQTNLLKRTQCANHWGDLRAALELAVERVIDAVNVAQRQLHDRKRFDPVGAEDDSIKTGDTDEVFEEEYHSDSERYLVSVEHQAVTQVVRRELCPALRDLIQHGLMEVAASSRSLLSLGGCLSRRSAQRDSTHLHALHAWHVFLRFYEMKQGREYNDSPARKLSQSFDLSMVGGKAITVKQQLLSAVDRVLTSHTGLKRSEDSQFKALVCLALNQHLLVAWLRLVLKNVSILDYCYQPWSYTVKTGFDDALHSLKRLDKIEFKLPFDLAVRQLINIRDAF